MRNFSKSKLLAFRQCPKRLWLEIHRPDLREDSAATQASFQVGHQVGLQNVLAHSAYGAKVFAQMGCASVMSQYQALVLGASGAIGSAFVAHFQNDSACSLVVGLSRQSELHFQLENEDSMAHCAAQLQSATGPFGACQFKWIIDATGALTIEGQGPEKRLEVLNAKQLLKQFEVNAVGPALLMKHFFPLLVGQEPSCYASLSARVGSIEDNHNKYSTH